MAPRATWKTSVIECAGLGLELSCLSLIVCDHLVIQGISKHQTWSLDPRSFLHCLIATNTGSGATQAPLPGNPLLLLCWDLWWVSAVDQVPHFELEFVWAILAANHYRLEKKVQIMAWKGDPRPNIMVGICETCEIPAWTNRTEEEITLGRWACQPPDR